jgi:hypothetical protein
MSWPFRDTDQCSIKYVSQEFGKVLQQTSRPKKWWYCLEDEILSEKGETAIPTSAQVCLGCFTTTVYFRQSLPPDRLSNIGLLCVCVCICVCERERETGGERERVRARACVHTGPHNLSKSVNFMQTLHKIPHTSMYSRQAHNFYSLLFSP